MFFRLHARATIYRLCCLAGLVLMVSATAARAQDTLTTNRATDVRAQPDDSAPSLQSLTAQSKVQLLERKGAWSRVKTDTHTGWVRMMHLRGGVTIEEAPQPTKSGGFLTGFNRLLGGSQPANQRAQSATLGVRGLSPEDLQTATPNPQQLAALKSFAANKPEAERFAKEVPLNKVDVADPADSARGGRR